MALDFKKEADQITQEYKNREDLLKDLPNVLLSIRDRVDNNYPSDRLFELAENFPQILPKAMNREYSRHPFHPTSRDSFEEVLRKTATEMTFMCVLKNLKEMEKGV